MASTLMAVVLVLLILIAKNIFKYKLGAKWHYFIWFVLIFRIILPWAPTSSLSVFNLFSFEKQASIIQTTNQEEHNIQVEIVNPAAIDTAAKEPNTEADTNTLKASQNQASSDYVKKFTINLKTLYWIWLSAALIVCLYIFLNSLIFEMKIKKHNTFVSREIFNIFLDCKYKLNVFANIPLIETPYVKSPTLIGFIKPRLLLPVNVLDTIPLEQLNYVFLHELVHFKRKDIGINLLTSIILIFHWFNPFIWYSFYKMRQDQEIACDALALSYIDQSELKEYALTLINLLESFSKNSRLPSATAGIGRTKLEIKRRIKMIKSYKKHSLKWSVVGFTFMIVLSMTSLTNPKVGILNTKALASKPDASAPIREVASRWINDYTYHLGNQDEKLIAYTITKYMNDVGNINYKTMNGMEGFEYLIPARQAQEQVWVETTLAEFEKNKMIYLVKDVDIEFISIHSEEATACLIGRITRVSESGDPLNVYGNKFKALYTLKKLDGKWMIITTTQNSSLAQMTLLPSYEETAIRNVVNKYINSNFTNVKNSALYIPPVTTSEEQIIVKSMLNISRAGKLEGLNVTYSEQDYTLQKIDDDWAIADIEAQTTKPEDPTN
jgi:bla regulator protein BlaR1